MGHERPYVTAILCIDYNTVGKWAEDNGINYTSYPELSQNPEVYDLVEKRHLRGESNAPGSGQDHEIRQPLQGI